MFDGLFAGPATFLFVVSIGLRAGACNPLLSLPRIGTVPLATSMLLLLPPETIGVMCPLRAMSCCSCEAWRSKEAGRAAAGVRP
jgi:hypothetical protein